jgi:signal transduction histidine kinase
MNAPWQNPFSAMRLARKLTVALTLGILAVMSAYAWLQIRSEVVLFEADLPKHRKYGSGFAAAIRAVWEKEGLARARQLVVEADRGNPSITIRWTWVDARPGDPERPKLDLANLALLAAGESVSITQPDAEGMMHRYTYVPVTVPGDAPAAIEVSESLRNELTFIQTNRRAMLLATLGIAAVCGLIAMGLGWWFVGRPMALLRDKTRRVGAGDFSGRLALRQRDEIGELADEINAMCDRIVEAHERLAQESDARVAAIEQLRHTDRLATVGQLASGVAHELGTPLNVVSARAKMIVANEGATEPIVQHARIIVEQGERMTDIIRQLLDFSRRRGLKPGLVDLRTIVTRAVDMVSSVAEASHVQIVTQLPGAPVLARADQGQLEQALTNFVLNGIQAMPQGGTLRVAASTRRVRPPADPGGPEAEYLSLIVTDEGEGISRENLLRIFEPFFTTKGVGQGTGLGLSVAYGIVSEHGGWIDVESQVGSGSRFTIHLPSATMAEAAKAAEAGS